MKVVKFFFTRIFSYASTVFFAVSTLLLVLTLLSRLGYFNFAGVSIVFSGSMEPFLRRGDLVLYCNTNFSVGDVVVYCRTASHCVIHRVVGFHPGRSDLVVTKGDANPVPDPPVDVDLVRGKQVLVVPREVWIPAAAIFTAAALYSMVRSGAVGYSYATAFSVAIAYLLAVYATIPAPILPGDVRLPVVRLSGVYFESANCSLRIKYHGVLEVTGASVYVNNSVGDVVRYGAREVLVRPPREVLRAAFESGRPLPVSVVARLNEVGTLTGNYTVLIGGADLEVRSERGSLLIENPNCFPVSALVSIRCGRGDAWYWVNRTHLVEGGSTLVLEPPGDCRYVYAYVYWYNQGGKRWVGVPVRTW